ncbi:MAG TPA: 3-hydroxyacyl-CoA dehydrogenase NAD-binding domain-containing protein, partial [Longimicrobiales bacterium]|nr:3-hydroxyacyl-CoA dehydrogenase NAD-binding domain-containing protein [Longimicrobiales bacterium]
LVEDVLPAEIFRETVESFVRARLEEGPVAAGGDRGLLTRLLDDTAPGRRVVLSQARKRVVSRTGGHYPAPLKILDVLRSGLGRPVERALEIEASAAGELIVSTVSKNLLRVFRLREAARKGSGVESEVEPRAVESIGVLGAGTMGGGIAQLAAYHDVRARMKDIEHEAVAGGLRHARSLFEKAVRRGKLARREADRKLELVSGGLDYAGFGAVDLVVEAVAEKMEVKRTVLREVEDRASDDCVLATNTSSLSVNEMAEALSRPENFGGMHFFNPVHKMPLVEVVRGRETSDRTVATIYTLALALGKVPVVVRKDGPGFLVNRILGPYLNEAGWLLADGARVEEVDEAAEEFGMPMGPLRLVDEVGIDVARHAGRTLHEALGDRLEPSPPLVAVGNTDRLGRKGGRGFYRYEDGDAKGVDPEIYDVLGDAVPPKRISIDRREIRGRLVLAMMNEAARVLEEGIVASAADVDLAMIMGTGFPPFRGGLLRFADELHPRTVLNRTEEYRTELGARFEPAPALRRLAEADREFYEAFP